MYSDRRGCSGRCCPDVLPAQRSSPLTQRLALLARPPLTPTIPNSGFDGYEPEHCGKETSYPTVGDEPPLTKMISTTTTTMKASATTSSHRAPRPERLAVRTRDKLPPRLGMHARSSLAKNVFRRAPDEPPHRCERLVR